MDRQVLTAQEVAEVCNISVNTAYKVIRGLNEELQAKGFLVFRGRVSRAYFLEKMYGMEIIKEA